MEKLKETVVKLCNSKPNAPLSDTQNAILEKHLNNLISNLQIAPEHPPYTWMIEKALRELDEEGGSSEDSISEFIKKEHKTLPWAHKTMLKHHLQKMIENREILMIDGRFLLPGDSESLKSKRKRKRKCVKRKKRGDLEIKQKSGQMEKEENKRMQHDDVEVVREQKDLDEQQNDVTVDGNCGRESKINEEYSELNEHHNEPSTDKEDAQLSGRKNDVTGNKVFHTRVLRSTVHKQKGKEQLDATEGSLQSSISVGSGIGCNAGSMPIEPPRFMMREETEHLQDLELQQSKLSISTVEETADISNLGLQESLENEQPGYHLPQLLSPEAPPGFEFMVLEDATANKSHTSSSVDLDLLKEHISSSVGLNSPKEDCVMHQSSDRPSKEEPVAEDLLKTKKHHRWQQTNRPITRAQKKGTVTPNEQVKLAMESSSEPKQPSIENSAETDRAQRQLKRWSKNPGEPKPVSSSKVEQLALCDSADQQLVLVEEPLSISKPLYASMNQQLVQMEEPLALATREEALNLTDPQHEVHLKQPKEKRSGRAIKGKDDGADPGTTLLKDVGSTENLAKKKK